MEVQCPLDTSTNKFRTPGDKWRRFPPHTEEDVRSVDTSPGSAHWSHAWSPSAPTILHHSFIGWHFMRLDSMNHSPCSMDLSYCDKCPTKEFFLSCFDMCLYNTCLIDFSTQSSLPVIRSSRDRIPNFPFVASLECSTWSSRGRLPSSTDGHKH